MNINILPENLVPNTLITLQMRGVAAIPVGHRVEVRIFNAPEKTSFLNLEKSKPLFDSPLVFDIDTGIYYGDLHQFYNLNHIYKPNQVFDAQITPFEHLSVYRAFEGLVQHCNVLSARMEGIFIQTTLAIKITKPITAS